MNRYLLNISYIGSNFRGLQRTKNLDDELLLRTTVQGSIELAILKTLKPVNENIKLILSSRTDAGVHALHSAVHIDLCRKNHLLYDETAITFCLNKFFSKENIQIRIISAEHVPDTFHARYNALSRTYLYRLGITKSTVPKELIKINPFYTDFIPIEEFQRCYFVEESFFNVEKAIEAANMFKGRHDFRTFMGATQQNSPQDHPFFALRSISDIEFRPGNPLVTSFCLNRGTGYYNYWDILIKGRSFLNRQVRRIVGVLIAVGLNRITLKDVYEMITIPSKNSWCPQASTVPPYGLYLCKVEYNEKDKKFPQSEPKT